MSRLIIEEPCGHPRPNTSVCVRFACTGMKRQVLAVDVDDLPTSMIEAAARAAFYTYFGYTADDEVYNIMDEGEWTPVARAALRAALTGEGTT